MANVVFLNVYLLLARDFLNNAICLRTVGEVRERMDGWMDDSRGMQGLRV